MPTLPVRHHALLLKSQTLFALAVTVVLIGVSKCDYGPHSPLFRNGFHIKGAAPSSSVLLNAFVLVAGLPATMHEDAINKTIANERYLLLYCYLEPAI